MKILLVLVAALGMVSNIFTQKPESTNSVGSGLVVAMDTLKRDTQTGLIEDENLYMVKAQCTSCHSSKLILQNRFTRDGWKQKIRWMQANHNLWNLGDTEKQVLDYLEKYYAPTAAVARRAPLKDIKWYKLEQK
ncbi:hypothetical protein [Dyadobacter pollutisoli]|uniref:Monoheme cytochrome C n=1 Tax=Dyadobacter pollutisoli TaxID=2910158 RepID=A0A9E8NEV3_9BACT|nr:hypothetical protein ON006_21890 [Dyadobacter pollutisoli]